MSATTRKQGRITVPAIRARKGAEPIVCLTAYTTPMAQRLDPHCDLLLVGDSLGMVVYGMESTLAVTVDMMINHGKAVMRGSSNACVIVDLPFGSYQESKEQAFRTASRILAETGCAGVKLEGGAELADTVEFLSQRGIPVMAHIGLMPQQVNTMGGFKSQGRGEEAAAKVIADAKAVAKAGAFSVVVEGTVEAVARLITTEIDIPTIGIGASVACDGQVLVTEDILGLFSDFTPKFVKRYADLGDQVSKAVESYATEVRNRQFPTDDHCFGVTKPGKLRAVK
ncbi:3-methyl-2-oxobutanoate hydroxymethyltransferase [Thalassospira sp. MBR-102]|jgi:3-methyl-2-oxobutanoate hydroxymethyltransferase|uniref:3-methyl-2-oxobutanoate hydroxymethyltransferase n=4 Tax=Thalassospira TaxID=168934 RepID=A0ABR5Y1G2_9PROT|nr:MULTISPECIES: 3-methyl-2-oxobutanoate hydroxymethyltransferase [Thalassospira]MAL29192.1 3-methyl-2-oxobutanoate hydroxymethyltransferase [Thalassospira sp.]MBR9780215.1 3-methyl-2-oxobutanoate hydroxymethyltransferase [Rhodospirillales bacterium]AJD50469.1 3-methyl-2-oxobutanoate hydroxymethyltransferase [Thalassospira xiamenensis M-5 = DSM 17429]KEO55778.1 3-methyl-2-oxobutanoate hydroxymethyltransferase [Thalassospira permensis NBRC 106175]KZD03676.1 3-methyl-2-oxobutanoate hydroxymethyl|tara:strand:- start:36586 stop:37434 length:849 start_codon:yes stop_codon:yes gene_type:complete